jgi:DNA polymerase III alpha subunit
LLCVSQFYKPRTAIAWNLFVSFEDTTGIYETVFLPKVYNQFCHMLNEMRPYILTGKAEEDFAAITLAGSSS